MEERRGRAAGRGMALSTAHSEQGDQIGKVISLHRVMLHSTPCVACLLALLYSTRSHHCSPARSTHSSDGERQRAPWTAQSAAQHSTGGLAANAATVGDLCAAGTCADASSTTIIIVARTAHSKVEGVGSELHEQMSRRSTARILARGLAWASLASMATAVVEE